MWGRGGRASMPVTTSRSCLFNGETSTLNRTSCGPGGGGSSMSTTRSTCAGSPKCSIWTARILIPLHRRLGGCVSLPNGYALLPRRHKWHRVVAASRSVSVVVEKCRYVRHSPVDKVRPWTLLLGHRGSGSFCALRKERSEPGHSPRELCGTTQGGSG